MHLMFTIDEATGKRIYTLKKVAQGQVTKSAHPARFSPDDKFSRQRVTLKKRYGMLLTQQAEKVWPLGEKATAAEIAAYKAKIAAKGTEEVAPKAEALQLETAKAEEGSAAVAKVEEPVTPKEVKKEKKEKKVKKET